MVYMSLMPTMRNKPHAGGYTFRLILSSSNPLAVLILCPQRSFPSVTTARCETLVPSNASPRRLQSIFSSHNDPPPLIPIERLHLPVRPSFHFVSYIIFEMTLSLGKRNALECRYRRWRSARWPSVYFDACGSGAGAHSPCSQGTCCYLSADYFQTRLIQSDRHSF